MAPARTAHKNRQGIETRRHLVTVAERLFAERGIDGVSIRAVNAAAALGAASVHYHFGSKQRLVEAVVDEHGSWVSARVNARVHELADRASPPTATDLVEAIAVPYVELLERDRARGLRWVKITAQLAMSGDDRLAGLYPEPSSRMLVQLRRAFPDVAEDRVMLRWSVAGRTLIQMLSHADRWSGDLRAYVAELVNFVAGGLSALDAEAGSAPRAA
jgi:AcrR family transcriptional regulator